MQTAGDGYLDSHELPPALYGLLNYDANGDGRISAAEYLGALRQVQLEMSLDQQYVSLPLARVHTHAAPKQARDWHACVADTVSVVSALGAQLSITRVCVRLCNVVCRAVVWPVCQETEDVSFGITPCVSTRLSRKTRGHETAPGGKSPEAERIVAVTQLCRLPPWALGRGSMCYRPRTLSLEGRRLESE